MEPSSSEMESPALNLDNLKPLELYIQSNFKDSLQFYCGFSQSREVPYLRIWNTAPTSDLAFLPAFNIIGTALSPWTFQLSLITYNGKVLEEAIVELPDEEKENSPNFPNFFWSICQNDYNLCQGIKPLKENSSDFFTSEHCGDDSSVCQRSKHCLFVANSLKNSHCSVCGSFCTETDQTTSEIQDADNLSQCNGSRPKRNTMSALKRLKSLKLPVSISIIEKSYELESDFPAKKSLRPEVRVKSEPICELFEPEIRIKSEEGYYDQESTHQEDCFDPSGWSDEYTADVKYELEISDEEDRPLKSRVKKVVPPKVEPPKKLGPPKKRAKRGTGPKALAKRNKQYLKILDYECKECSSKFSGPTEFFDHARIVKCPTAVALINDPDMFIKQCTICLRSFDSPALYRKDQGFHNENLRGLEDPVQCPICFKNIETRRVLNIHYSLEHADDPDKSMCCICYSILPRGRMTFHFFKIHPSQNKIFLCPICGKEIRHKMWLHKHLAAVHRVLEDGVSPAPLHICEVCGKECLSFDSLTVHRYKKHRSTLSQCDECEKAFTYKSQMIAHKVSVHLQVKPYSCRLCVHSTSQTSAMFKHYKFIHKVRANREDIGVDQEKLEMIREILGYDYGSAITDDLKLRLKKNNKLESSQNQ